MTTTPPTRRTESTPRPPTHVDPQGRVAGAEPGRPRAREQLIAAFHQLHQRGHEIDGQVTQAQTHYGDWIEARVNELGEGDEGQVNLQIPRDIEASRLAAIRLVAELVEQRAGLLTGWAAAGIEGPVPDHGLPPASRLALQFAAQSAALEPPAAQRTRLAAELLTLQQRANVIMGEQRQLDLDFEAHGLSAALIDAVADLEASYAALWHGRRGLLRQWDAAGLGAQVPHHGLTPEAHFHFNNFELLDQYRLNALALRS